MRTRSSQSSRCDSALAINCCHLCMEASVLGIRGLPAAGVRIRRQLQLMLSFSVVNRSTPSACYRRDDGTSWGDPISVARHLFWRRHLRILALAAGGWLLALAARADDGAS